MSNSEAVLNHEFAGNDGSFLILLHTKEWNWVAYNRLFAAMRECCQAMEGRKQLNRWLAEGFWYLSWYPRQQAALRYPNDMAIQNGVVNLDHLAFWFFAGDSRGQDDFEPVPVSNQISN